MKYFSHRLLFHSPTLSSHHSSSTVFGLAACGGINREVRVHRVSLSVSGFLVIALKLFKQDMSSDSSSDVLKEILDGLKALRQENSQLASAVDLINGRVNMLAGVKQLKDEASSQPPNGVPTTTVPQKPDEGRTVEAVAQQYEQPPTNLDASPHRASVSKTSKIILTSYPGQAGVDPLPMQWGDKDFSVRGPVVVSRHPSTIRRRNGMLFSAICLRLITDMDSYWRTWGLLFHLPCSGGSKQELRCESQTRLYQY